MGLRIESATGRRDVISTARPAPRCVRASVGSARKPPKTYRYNSSLEPALSWDENRDRDLVEWLTGLVQRCATDGEAAVFSQPLVWAGGGVQVQSLKARPTCCKPCPSLS